jgi:beta-carotene hydroxylase
MTRADVTPPPLANLGRDLVHTSGRQRALAVMRPFIGLAAYMACWSFGLWWLLPLAVFAIFVAVVTVTHDVVHGSLGLRGRSNEVALFIFGAIVLESGHAYRTTHRQHHRVFPGDDDPEGDPARLTLRSAILYGPLFLPRLWWWAFRRQKRRRDERIWLLLEAAFACGYVATAIALLPYCAAPAVYGGLVIIGSWTYPLLTVHLPHRHYGETPWTQTHTLRGRIVPSLFLELTYHLEHHLYPQVPSHRLPELSRRLDPYLRAAGVTPTRVP